MHFKLANTKTKKVNLMGLRDKLAATRQKSKERKAGSTRLFKWKNGKTKFRFLPGLSVPADFFREYGLHWLRDQDGKPIGAVGDRSICYEGEECIIRDGLQEAKRYANQIEDEKLEERVGNMLAKSRYIALIEVIDAPGEVPSEPVLADFPYGTFNAILSMMEDVFEEAESEEDGTAQIIGDNAIVFQIEREGSGMNTEYTPTITRKSAPMSEGALEGAVSIDDWIAAQFEAPKLASATKVISEMLGRPLDSDIIEGALTSSASETKALEGPSEEPSLSETLDDEIPLDGAASSDDDANDAVDPSTLEGGDDLMNEIDNL